MSNLGINDGHTIRGVGCGAVGIISESEHTRLVGAEIRRLITERGHNSINCTVDYANTVSESLELVVEQANREDLDWFIAIHFNAGGGKGVEVYTYNGRQYQDALDVCSNISNLGFRNRGVKEGQGLYVIRKTKAKSMLIEICFVDTDDANKYLEVGYKNIAKAIVDALIGHVESLTGNNGMGYVRTNYLPKGYKGNGSCEGIDLEYTLQYFDGARCYMRANGKGQWIETQILPMDRCNKIKGLLGSWFYDIVAD